MSNKQELLDEAKSRGLKVNHNLSKAELQELLDNDANVDTTSAPENDVDTVETTPAPNDTAKKADEDRTKEEVEFADESNPNQKARTDGATDELDQDGNRRTGGYSYGVAANDTDGTVPEPQNEGADKPAEGEANPLVKVEGDAMAALNQDQNNEEWEVKEQQKLEERLSLPDQGVMARVITSLGQDMSYVKVKFFWNNKPLGIYKSRQFDEAKATEFRDELLKNKVETA